MTTDEPALRLVVMGTGPFAAPAMDAMCRGRHQVAALVTQPLRPVRGKRKTPATPMRDVAAEHGVPVLDPVSVNDPAFHPSLEALQPDLFVVADYGQILSPDTLRIAPLGGINLHGSLLPKYRGAAPINWAIYHGETTTGVTVIHMTPRVDAGPCIAQAELAIGPDETAEALEPRLAQLGAPLVCETIEALQSGQAKPLPQDPTLATRAPRLKKSDGAIDWRRPARQIKNHIRAMQPWPGCYSFLYRKNAAPLRLIITRAEPVERLLGESTTAPGVVLPSDEGRLHVASCAGAVSIETLQPAGKRPMSAAEFLRGHPSGPGDRFGESD